MAQCKIVIADDHQVVIEGIKSLLADKSQYRVVGEAVNGNQAVDLAVGLRPDIVIMDISMPALNGVEATRKIKKAAPEVKIIIYTMHSDQRFILELFKAGISGHVLKEGAPSDLVSALEQVSQGKTYFSETTPTALVEDLLARQQPEDDRGEIDCLSPRESEVFKLLADGQPIKSIADKLCISPKTVETHKYNVMDKLGVDTVTGLTKMAIKHHLINI